MAFMLVYIFMVVSYHVKVLIVSQHTVQMEVIHSSNTEKLDKYYNVAHFSRGMQNSKASVP